MRISELLSKDFSARELKDLNARDTIIALWKADGIRVAVACRHYAYITDMTFDDFLTHCTACGGNWGGMFLTGIKELFPEVYEVIPDDMGVFAFTGIVSVLEYIGVKMPEG